jgi:hypothetical protein
MARIDDMAWAALLIGWYATGILWLAAWYSVTTVLR